MFDGLTSKQKIITIVIISVAAICILLYVYNKNRNYNYIDDTEILTKNIEKENNFSENEDDKGDSKEIIVVHVAGEVNNPGIVKLEEGQRIEDAINAAGGFTENADVSSINLAYVLEDGIKINIPNKKAEQENYITSDIGDNILENDSKNENKQIKKIININKATQKELENLQGIGPSLAEKIIEYRKQNGRFNTIEDLKNVNGIGDTKFEKIKDNISVK